MKLSHFIFILSFFICLLGCKAKMDVEIEKTNPFEGTTWEMVSGEYTWGDTTFTRPTSGFHKGIVIWGKTHLAGIWQDTSKQDFFYAVHKYSIDGDTVTLTPKLFADPKVLNRPFKLKYEIKENEYTVSGIMQRKKWNIGNHDMNIYEVYKRID